MDRLIRLAWVFGVTGLISLLGAGGLFFIYRETSSTISALLALGGFFLALYVLLDRDRVSESVQSRSAQRAGGVALLTTLALALTVGLYSLALRQDHTWDLTKKQSLSLSEQTQQILASTGTDVEIIGFFKGYSQGSRQFRKLAEAFRVEQPDLAIRQVDPLQDPLLARKYEVSTEWGSIIVARGARKERLETDFSEKAVINAIIRVTSEKDHRICWSVGHGESGSDDEGNPSGMANLVLALDDQNYQVTNTAIATDRIDSACEALVIAWPMTDFLPHEREAVAAYVASGGRVLALFEPDLGMEQPYAPQLAANFERYGVAVGKDMVLETNSSYLLDSRNPADFILRDASFGHHPITAGLHAAVTMATTRSIRPIEGKTGVNVQVLAQTTEESWAETSPIPPIGPDPDEATGSIPVAVAVQVEDPTSLAVVAHVDHIIPVGAFEATQELAAGIGVPADFIPKPGGRLVVIGDAEFASNQRFSLGNNRDLVMNSLAWLIDEDEQLGERPEDEGNQRLTITGVELLALDFIAVLLVPGLAAAMALGVMIRRRFL